MQRGGVAPLGEVVAVALMSALLVVPVLAFEPPLRVHAAPLSVGVDAEAGKFILPDIEVWRLIQNSSAEPGNQGLTRCCAVDGDSSE